MPANLNVWVVCSVGESERVLDPAYGTHRVPYADEIRLTRRTGKMRLEFIRQFEDRTHLRRLVGLCSPLSSVYGHLHADGIRHKRFVSFSDQPVHVEERGNGACRVCASTKAEQKQPIAFLNIIHKEDVRVANIRFEPITDCLPGQFGELAAEGGERARSLHRAQAGVIKRHLSGRVVNKRVKEFDDVCPVPRELVRGSITADNDILRHRSGLWRSLRKGAVSFLL